LKIGRDDWIRTSDPLTPSPIPSGCWSLWKRVIRKDCCWTI